VIVHLYVQGLEFVHHEKFHSDKSINISGLSPYIHNFQFGTSSESYIKYLIGLSRDWYPDNIGFIITHVLYTPSYHHDNIVGVSFHLFIFILLLGITFSSSPDPDTKSVADMVVQYFVDQFWSSTQNVHVENCHTTVVHTVHVSFKTHPEIQIVRGHASICNKISVEIGLGSWSSSALQLFITGKNDTIHNNNAIIKTFILFIQNIFHIKYFILYFIHNFKKVKNFKTFFACNIILFI